MEEEDDKPPKPTTTAATTTLILVSVLFFLLLLLVVVSADDTAIMMDLSKSLHPTPPGWIGPNPCKWTAVTCDSFGHVTDVSIAGKSIYGTLPANLPKLSSLQTLSLQKNHLTGTIPAISDMPDLREVYLDENEFTRLTFPFLSNLPSLQYITLEDNPLDNWSIPLALSNSTSLQKFHAANSSLRGSIPDIFGSFTSLTSLRLSYNDLAGELPASLGSTFIQNLWINNQKHGFTGGLFVLETMTSLMQVWVHANAFIGPIPDLSKCVSLFDLQLRDNRLTGIVPISITNLPKLLNISIQNNKLQGPMPIFQSNVKVSLGNTNSFCLPTPGPCDPQVTALLEIVGAFGYPSTIANSWTGNDACKNWVHVTCDPTRKVSIVNFAKLGWFGTISPAFANLTSLTSVILSDNNLVGTIPDVLTSLKMLRNLDLSNNNLTGNIPSFPSSVSVIVNGNPFLGTNVDTSNSVKSPPGLLNSPSGTAQGGGRSGNQVPRWVVVGIVIGCLFFLAALGVAIYLYIKMNNAIKREEIESFKMGKSSRGGDLEKSAMDFAFASPIKSSNLIDNIHSLFDNGSLIPIEILREVTGQFSEKKILGRGGFGIVYKGDFKDGTQTAVKRMVSNMQGTKGRNEFEAEIAVLSKVRHRNLVALLGYCVTRDERIVVYEYMPQGTLAQHLFECNDNGLSRLTWKQRLVIALDVARGVEYLHSLAQQSFIHRDLKPSNILLGDNMRAKVSDFGLVKSAPDQGRCSVETRLAGTFGYLAPEYAATGRVTTKVDVFAFGVVLMELITGRKALDERLPDDEAQLVNWFRRVMIATDSITKALDPYLEAESEDAEILSSIWKVAELSVHCTVREPLQRPDMSHAVNVLSPLVSQWRPTEVDDDDDHNNSGIDNDMSLTEAMQRWQSGETTVISESSSVYDSRNYQSDATTPSMNESFVNVRGR